MRGLRTVPVVLGIVRDMEELCPDAWFLNYTNPMAILVRAVAERSEIRDDRPVPQRLLDDRCARRLHGRAAGRDRPRHRRRQPPGLGAASWSGTVVDLYPALRAAVDAGRVPPDDLVRAELYPPVRLLPDRVLGAPRRVQPVVHPQGRPRRALQHPDRRVPRPGRQQPRRVRGHEAPARRRRAVRDRAQRRVRGRHRARQGDGRAGTDRRERDERRPAHPQPRRRRLRRGPVRRRRLGRPSDRDRPAARASAPPTSILRSTRRPSRSGRPRRGPRGHLPRGALRPPGPGPSHARRSLADDRRAHRRRGTLAARRGLGGAA